MIRCSWLRIFNLVDQKVIELMELRCELNQIYYQHPSDAAHKILCLFYQEIAEEEGFINFLCEENGWTLQEYNDELDRRSEPILFGEPKYSCNKIFDKDYRSGCVLPINHEGLLCQGYDN